MEDQQALAILDQCVAARVLNRADRQRAEAALQHVARRLRPQTLVKFNAPPARTQRGKNDLGKIQRLGA